MPSTGSTKWPPTPVDMIFALEGASESWVIVQSTSGRTDYISGPGRGVAVYEAQYVEPLIADGLAQYMEGVAPGKCVYLTPKGKEALALLKGEITSSKFRQPDWLLEAVTA